MRFSVLRASVSPGEEPALLVDCDGIARRVELSEVDGLLAEVDRFRTDLVRWKQELGQSLLLERK